MPRPRDWTKDLVGRIFVDLTVLERVAQRHGKAQYRCKCSCGNVLEIAGWRLQDLLVSSCGCQQATKRNICTPQGVRLNRRPVRVAHGSGVVAPLTYRQGIARKMLAENEAFRLRDQRYYGKKALKRAAASKKAKPSPSILARCTWLKTA